MIAALNKAGRFEAGQVSRTDLHGTFNSVKVEIMCTPDLLVLEPPLRVEGLDVASVHDIMAMKLRALLGRSKLRDYFDIMCVEEKAEIRLEEGIALYARKFGLPLEDWTVHAIVRALGYLDGIEDDPMLRSTAGENVRDSVVHYFAA